MIDKDRPQLFIFDEDRNARPLLLANDRPKPTATITVPKEAGLKDLASSRFMTAEILQTIMNRNDISFRVYQDGQPVGNLVNLKGAKVTGVDEYEDFVSVGITWDETTSEQ